MDKSRDGQKRTRLESRVRSGFEWFFLVLGLLVGLGVVGGCGSVAVLSLDLGPSLLAVLGAFAAAAILIGIVYLSTSMSRDVRVLREALLDETRQPESRQGDTGP